MNSKTKNFYNKFSFLYPLADVFLKPQKRRLFEEINKSPSGSLLEIGVGNGAHLTKYRKHRVIGIDTSRAMLKIAQRNAPANIGLLQMDGENLLFADDLFDYVVLSHVLAVVDDPEKILQEACRVLKKNGKIFVLNHFTPNNCLLHVDRLFNSVSKRFHFRSLFYKEKLNEIGALQLCKEIDIDPFSYFKLLIFCKL